MESAEQQNIGNEEEEVIEQVEIKAQPGQEPIRIDLFLRNQVEKISRTKIQYAAKTGCITVNGKAVKSNYKLRPNDEIKFVYPKLLIPTKLIPEDIPLDVVYEDDDLIVVNKQPNLVVHPGVGNHTGTLVNALAFHCNEQLPVNSNNKVQPGLVHRLDKNTSGLMVVAKNELSMAHLAKQFYDRTIQRRYVAIVWGDLAEDEGTITGHIGRHQKHRKVFTVYPDGEWGKHAVTHYKVLERFGYINLVECKLETGRTHQIRVHMKWMGHPIFSDEFYGGDKIVKGTVYTKYRQFVDNCFKILPRQALHAKELGFVHPTTEEVMHFEQPMPDEFTQVLDKWRTFMNSRQ